MGTVQGRLDFRFHAGGVQSSSDGGATWTAVSGTGDAWYDAAVAAMRAAVPALGVASARFEYIKIGHRPGGAIDSTIAIDAPIQGGGLGVVNDATHLKFTSSIWQAPRTDPMAVVFRAKFPTITAAKTALVSITTVGAGGNVPFGWDFVTNATKWVMLPVGGTPVISAVNTDTAIHTFMITSDGTTLKAWIDGVVVATSPDVATLTNTPCCVSSFASASLTPGVLTSRIAYGYLDPS